MFHQLWASILSLWEFILIVLTTLPRDLG
ncbi:unnamed protein product, partial [Rotaria socialis]